MLNQIRKARQDESGFTLIELLIVIVVLGILAGIVVFAVNGITDRGAASACATDYKSVQVASEAFHAQSPTGGYAADSAALVSGGLLRSYPTSDKYTITYTSDGKVAASGACTFAAG